MTLNELEEHELEIPTWLCFNPASYSISVNLVWLIRVYKGNESHERVFLFVTSNRQTTNLDFPNFFLSFSSWKRKQTFYLSNTGFFFSLLDQWLVSFLFNCSNWEKFVEKIGENKIGCLVVRSHEQDYILVLVLPS